MTLVVTINGPETIWLLADRRLSRGGQPWKEDARKVMFLETTDGVAILGYAGLGATALGTEPSDWMSAVLRARNFPLEQSLGALAEAMKKQFPRHMVRMPGAPAHNIIVPAFFGGEPRLYTIDLAFGPDRKSYAFRYTRHAVGTTTRPPRMGLGGTGGIYLLQQKDKKWIRSLLRVVKANARGQVFPDVVADHLADLNYEVSRRLSDKSVPLGVRDTVGPNCIAAWRHRKGGVHDGGGGHEFYTGTTRDASSPSVPTIARGIDVSALVALEMPHVIKMFEAMRAGEPPVEENKDEINARLARLPDKPDESLR